MKNFLDTHYPNKNIKIRNDEQMQKLPCEIQIKNKKIFHTYSVPLGVVDIKEKKRVEFFYFTTNLKNLKEQDCTNYWQGLNVYCADSFKEPHSTEKLDIIFSQFKQQNIQQYLYHTFNLIHLFNQLRPHTPEKPDTFIESLRKQFGLELIQKIFIQEPLIQPESEVKVQKEEEEDEPEVVKKVKTTANPRKK